MHEESERQGSISSTESVTQSDRTAHIPFPGAKQSLQRNNSPHVDPGMVSGRHAADPTTATTTTETNPDERSFHPPRSRRKRRRSRCSKRGPRPVIGGPDESDSVKSEARLRLQMWWCPSCRHQPAATTASAAPKLPRPGSSAELIVRAANGEHRALRHPRPRLPLPGTHPLSRTGPRRQRGSVMLLIDWQLSCKMELNSVAATVLDRIGLYYA